MRVLQLIEPAPFGGAESVVRALTKALCDLGTPTEIAAIVPPGAEHRFVVAVRAAGVRVTIIPRSRRHAEIRAVRDLLRSRRITLLHTHVMRANLIGAIAARLEHVPTISTQHGFTGTGWRGALYTCLDVVLMRRSNSVIAVSKPIRERLLALGCSAAKVHTIPNAWETGEGLSQADARDALGIPSDRPVVGFVGRLSHVKGADLLIDALEMNVPSCTAVFIGDGEDREILQAKAAATDRHRWIFSGIVPNADRLLRAFDALVISSRSEGTPMVLLEAMGRGVPVIAFAVGGIPQTLSEDTGWLVPPLDIRGLAMSLKRTFESPAEAARRAASALETVANHHSAAVWAAETLRLYRELIDQKR